MWSTAWNDVIVKLHGLARPVVVVVTGGGASAIAALLAVPGASRTILDAHVPYSAAALTAWLGRQPDQYCDARTALAMASVACERANQLTAALPNLQQPLGVSCTAALASERPKRGDHRCFIAVQSADLTACVSLTLQKGARTRAAEEAVVSQLIVRTLAEICGVADLPALDLLPTERIHLEIQSADPALSAVWKGAADCVWSFPDGSLAARPPEPVVGVLCGAFDPLHRGHMELRDVAEQRLGGLVAYELSIANVDKPPLDFLTISHRRQQFTHAPLALTNAPRFWQKSQIFPGMTFVVGSDTAARIIDPYYYAGDQAALAAALAMIRQQGCRFLVASRQVNDQLLTLSDMQIPSDAADLFEAIPEQQFRVDISSTELRKQQ